MTLWLNVKNNAESALASAITAAATTLTLVSGEGLKFPSANFNITIDDEILTCSTRTGDILTVTRAQEGTTAAIHAAGAIVSLNITAAVITELQTAKDSLTSAINTVLSGLITPVAGEILRLSSFTMPSAFSGKINGAPSVTSVVYNTDTNEGSLIGINVGATYWGRIMLWNSTRSTYRKIVSVDVATNTITTESCADAWASGDNITTQSQVNTTAGYFDIDLSAQVTISVTGIFMSAQIGDGSNTVDGQRALILHPYAAYDAGKRSAVINSALYEVSVLTFFIPVYSQKITCYCRGAATSTLQTIILLCKGVITSV